MKLSNRRRVKQGSESFFSCPECGSPNLITFEDEVLCSYCGWDSIEIRSEARFIQSSGSRAFEEASETMETFESIHEREDYNSNEARRLIHESSGFNHEFNPDSYVA